MTTTVPYFGYSVKQGFSDSLEEEPSNHAGEQTTRAALSPSDTPDAAVIEVAEGNTIRLILHYSNREPSETEWRRASPDGAVRVLLGKITRKVLEVECANALEVLAHKSPVIDPEVLVEWTSGLPAHAYKTSLRSSLLASHLLESMPKVTRKTVVDLLRGKSGR